MSKHQRDYLFHIRAALAALLILASSREAFSQFGRVIYISPDKNLRAVVTPVDKAGAFRGSEVAMRSTDGRIITRNIYGSDNGKHRGDVICGAWSPDSEFFVYNVTILMPHSASDLETYVFVRRLSQVYDLGPFIRGPLVDPQFLLPAGSRLLGARLKSNLRLERFEVELSKIAWTKKK